VLRHSLPYLLENASEISNSNPPLPSHDGAWDAADLAVTVWPAWNIDAWLARLLHLDGLGGEDRLGRGVVAHGLDGDRIG